MNYNLDKAIESLKPYMNTAGYTKEDIISRGRERTLSLLRDVAIVRMVAKGVPRATIAKELGRDVSAISHAVRRTGHMEGWSKDDICNRIADIKKKVDKSEARLAYLNKELVYNRIGLALNDKFINHE